MKQKIKFVDLVQIMVCVLAAFFVGMLIAVPALIKLDMNLAIIDFLHRH